MALPILFGRYRYNTARGLLNRSLFVLPHIYRIDGIILVMAKEKPKATTNIRQKKLIKKILENSGKPISISQSMKEVGYGEGYAKNPQYLTNTKSWQQLMDEYLPDDLIARKHNELLNKTDKDGEIDANAVKSGIDLAYKVKGRFAPEKIEHTITAVKIVNYGDDLNEK